MLNINNTEKCVYILKLLERNGFDFDATSRESGYSRADIEKAYAAYGDKVFDNTEAIQLANEYHAACYDIDLDFIKKASIVRDKVINSIEGKIDECKNISELTNLLKVLNDIIGTNTKVGQSNAINVNFIEKIEHIYNNKGRNKIKKILNNGEYTITDNREE